MEAQLGMSTSSHSVAAPQPSASASASVPLLSPQQINAPEPESQPLC